MGVTADFLTDEMSGQAPVNRYFAEYTVEGESIEFGEIGQTLMAGDPELMTAESAYFVGIWWFLVGYGTQDKGLHEGWYVAATAAHWLATAWMMALVARDAWSPQHDPIRTDGYAEDAAGAVALARRLVGVTA